MIFWMSIISSLFEKLILEINYPQVTPWGHRHSLSIGSLNFYTYSSTQFGHATLPGDNQKAKKTHGWAHPFSRHVSTSVHHLGIQGGWYKCNDPQRVGCKKVLPRTAHRGQKLLAPLANLWLFRPLPKKKNKNFSTTPKISSRRPFRSHENMPPESVLCWLFFRRKLSA